MTNNRRKVSRFFFSGFTLPLIILTKITFTVYAGPSHAASFDNNLTALQDTTPPSKRIASDSLNRNLTDSLGSDTLLPATRVDTFSVRMSRDSITDPIDYKADSMVLEVKDQRILLFGKSEVKYTNIQLSAPTIFFDQATQMVTARMGRDTAGNVTGMARLVQGENTTVSDSIRFNFKTQKGLTHNTFFQQQEIFNFAQEVKKVDAETFYAYRGRFTTCNLDTPHFAFRFKKAKFVNQKVAVTGPVHPEFENVPIPIYLPFSIFPLKTGRHSGLIPPTLTFTEDFGLGLEGLGYYKVINDYFDFKVWSDFYSYGSWRLNFAPTYRKRYHYSGGMNISFQNTKFAFKGDPDYSVTKTFFISWNHTMDSKARPGVNFSANVNAGSSKYLRNVPNGALVNPGTPGNVAGTSYYQPMNFTNQLSSSISYQKTWLGTPFNIAVNLNHNQNTSTKLINLNLPDIGFNMNTIYPFQQKEFAGASKWYEKLGIAYNGNYKGQLSFYDTAFNFQQLVDTFQWGASHNIPITLSLPPLGPVQIAPSVSYRERWYAQQFIRSWDGNAKKLDTTINKGFYSSRETSFGLSVSTAVFGTLISKNKDAHIQALRHVMRPQVGINYKPDLQQPYYYRTQVDTTGRQVLFSVFDGSIFGPFSPGKSGGISFGLDNNLEMKVKSRKDTGENAIKKVKLIDGFGISGGYNFLADSFKLSTFNIYARSNLFEIVNITANAILDPYQRDPQTGYPVDKYAWEGNGFSLGSITSGNLNISTRFQSKKGQAEKNKKLEELEQDNFDQLTPDQMMQQLDYVRRNPAEFADFNVPWSINLGYSLSFFRTFKSDYSGFKTEISSNINFTGDVNLTPKWKLGGTGYYDFKTAKLQSLNMFISRDLHCWQLAINVTPVGLYRYFSITINPKSGLLRDLRINRTRYFYNQ